MPGATEAGRARGRAAGRVVLAELIVGLGYAAMSAYWAAGGRGLLSTVGSTFVQAAQAGGALVTAGAWLVVVVKVIAALLPAVALTSSSWPRSRRPGQRRAVRLLACADAVILTLYGLVLTVAGLLVQGGVIRSSAGADHRALAWHAYLWDPWFLVWGILAGTAMVLGRAGSGRGQLRASDLRPRPPMSA